MRRPDEYLARLGVGSPLPHKADGARIRKDPDGNVTLPPHTRPLRIQRMADYPEPPPREYVLSGLVPEGAATALFGAGGVAKSLLALDLSISVARGAERWLGRELRGSAVLYLDFELTPDEQRRRASSLLAGAGQPSAEMPDELFYASAVGEDSESAFWSAYARCLDEGVGLLVVDSYGLAMQGELVSNTDILEFFRTMIEPFIVEGIAVLFVDHQAKNGDRYQDKTMFGGTYKHNTVRSVIQLEKVDQDERGNAYLILRHNKHNFGMLQAPFGAMVEFEAGEIRVGPRELTNRELAQEDGTKATDRVLLAMTELEDQATVSTVAEFTGMNYKTVVSAVRTLKYRGKIEESSRRHRGANVLVSSSASLGNGVVTYG